MTLAVILPVYNSANFLPECVESLLNQTFDDFVILAINDCSTDESGQILETYMRRDKRLRVYHLPSNQGEQGAMQFAFNMLKTMRVPYVARMDSDDVSFPNRFAKQIEFLSHHQDIMVVGSNVQMFDTQLRHVTTLPENDGDIKMMMLFAAGNLLNPTTMWRNDWFRQHDIAFGQYRVAGDYAMWVNCALKGAKFANLPDTLLCYRLHGGQLSQQTDWRNQVLGDIWHKYAAVMLPYLSQQERETLGIFCYQKNGKVKVNREQFQQFVEIVDKISLQHQASILCENASALVARLQNMVARARYRSA